MNLTITQLLTVMPGAISRMREFYDPLTAAMDEFDINTPRRRAAFLCQVAHESGELRYVCEISDGKQYEGRADLGNTQPGDGQRFKGRGLLQATGRFMYERLSQALNIDFVATPELLEQPIPASRSAGYIWTVEKKLNTYADQDQIAAITYRINGGYNGLDSRIGYWMRARRCEGL